MLNTCVVQLKGKKQKWPMQRLIEIFKGENNKFDKVWDIKMNFLTRNLLNM